MSSFRVSLPAPFEIFQHILEDLPEDGGRCDKQKHSRSARIADRLAAPTDVAENQTTKFIFVNLPGLTKDAVNLSLVRNTLTVSGENPANTVTEDAQFSLQERPIGSFSRSFRVPAGLKSEEIKASMHNGLLTLAFPKEAAEPEAKRVEIT